MAWYSKRSARYPEVLAGMAQMSAAAAEYLKESPMYQSYVSVAPHPEAFPTLVEKMGDLLRQEYDWSDEVAGLKLPVVLVFGDADSVPPTQVARFFELLGGGKADAGWDGSNIPRSRLAILPVTTHYNIFASPALMPTVAPFLDAPIAEAA